MLFQGKMSMLTEISTGKLAQYFSMIITIAFIGVLCIILTIIVLTFKNWAKWKAGFIRAQKQEWKKTHRPDGNLYPPVARGICEQCEKYSPCVFCTPDGLRICKSCYDDQHADEYNNNVNCPSGKNLGEDHE
jgi:hypothetical protein